MSELKSTGTYRLVIRSDEDLANRLLQWATDNKVNAARFKATGFLKSAALQFFHQVEKETTVLRINRPVELVSLNGNISERNGVTEITGKLLVADSEHKVMGGGLTTGSKVFTVEVFIDVFETGSLKRVFQSQTGLNTWQD